MTSSRETREVRARWGAYQDTLANFVEAISASATRHLAVTRAVDEHPALPRELDGLVEQHASRRKIHTRGKRGGAAQHAHTSAQVCALHELLFISCHPRVVPCHPCAQAVRECRETGGLSLFRTRIASQGRVPFFTAAYNPLDPGVLSAGNACSASSAATRDSSPCPADTATLSPM